MKTLGRESSADLLLPSERLLAKFAPLRPIDGCGTLLAHQSQSLFALWEAWEAECLAECPIPFWATVWPAGLVLARHLLKNPSLVAGKRVVEIGCGGGAVAIAAAHAGARRVVANDIDPIALSIARRNFSANRVTIETCARNFAERPGGIAADLILVADLFYHRTAAASLVTFLRQALKTGASVLIADGNRPFTPATGIALLAKETVPVSREVEGVPQREVRLLALEA